MLNAEQIPPCVSPPHLCTPSRLAGELRMIDLLRRLADVRTIHTVLDVGCGAGEYRFLFPGCRYTGIDVLDHAFAWKQEDGVTLKVGDACRIPEESHSFDLVFSSYAFEYFSDPLKALSEIRRVLNERGVAVICLPTAAVKFYELVPHLFGKDATQLGPVSALQGIRHYSPAELRALGAKAGLDMVGHVPIYGWATLLFKFLTIVYRAARHLASRRRGDATVYPLYANRLIGGACSRAEWRHILDVENARRGWAGALYIACIWICAVLDHLALCHPLAEYIAVFRKAPVQDQRLRQMEAAAAHP